MIKHLTDYLENTVKNIPDRIAIIDEENDINFSTLVEKAKKFASYIYEKSEGIINIPISVYNDKCINTIIANIAILYSGNYYMNLDVKAPLLRIVKIIENVKPKIIITTNKYIENISTICNNILIINLDSIDMDCISANTKLLETNNKKLISTDPVCIINTSGSTGIPKSVVLNHMSFIDFTEWAIETLCIGNDEIVGSLSPVIFDIYSFELCMLMAKGSTIVIIPEKLTIFPINILQLLEKQKVTFIFWVPTIMVNIANMGLLEKINLPQLRTIWFAGEIFPTKQFNIWRKNLTNARFINLYGPIEITIDCTYFIIDREINDNEPIPIGYPCQNTDIMILTDGNELALTNEEGELCVRGISLAMGYYNNPDTTKAVFVQNPLNNSYPELIYRTGDIIYKNERGEIIFKGRKDTLIKHLGYRIELGEIEHVIINTLQLVKNGCAVYNDDKKEIVFFYESLTNISPTDIRIQLSEMLPKYMLPTKYYHMDELPRNPNGKIDRLRLKQDALK